MNTYEVYLFLTYFIIILPLALITLKRELIFKKKSRIIIGVVIDNKSKGESYTPIIEYYDNITEETYTFHSEYGFGKRTPGSKVKIRVLTVGKERRNEISYALHIKSICLFLLCLATLFIPLSYYLNNDIKDTNSFLISLVMFPFVVIAYTLFKTEYKKLI